MTTTYTNLLRLAKQGTGDNTSTWGAVLNEQVYEMLEDAVTGVASIVTAGGTTTLTTNNGVTDEARMAVLDISGVLTSNATIIVPTTVTRPYLVRNRTTGAFTVTVKTLAGTGIVVTQGTFRHLFADGTNVADVLSAVVTGTGTFTGALIGTTGTFNSTVQATQFTSTIATGTAPLTVASTTKVVNLNADLLDGFNADAAENVNTIALRNSSGELYAHRYISTILTGAGAPLIVTSTARVTNLNSNFLQEQSRDSANVGSTIVNRDGNGDFAVRSIAFERTTGVSPFTVVSTTKVTNLNADLLDGLNSATTPDVNTIAARDGSGTLFARIFDTTGSGAAEVLKLITASASPNIAFYPSNGAYSSLIQATTGTFLLSQAAGNITFSAPSGLVFNSFTFLDASRNFIGAQYQSSVSGGTAPITTTSTTLCSNLHAEYANKIVRNAVVNSISAAADGGGPDTLFSGVSSTAALYRVKLTFIVSTAAFGFAVGDEIQCSTTPDNGGGPSMVTIYRTGTTIKMMRAAVVQYVRAPDGSNRRLNDDIPGTYTAELILEGNY